MTDPVSTPLDCGKSVAELSDYLAADRTPYDADIETCPECANALQALTRVSAMSRDLLARDAAQLPPPPGGWLQVIMSNIRDEVRAGRRIPVSHPDPRARITLTEGAVRAVVRSAGDDIEGLIIGRCEIVGEVEEADAVVDVNVTASVAWGEPLADIAAALRRTVREVLRQHTELNIGAVNVAIEDLHSYDSDKEST